MKFNELPKKGWRTKVRRQPQMGVRKLSVLKVTERVVHEVKPKPALRARHLQHVRARLQQAHKLQRLAPVVKVQPRASKLPLLQA